MAVKKRGGLGKGLDSLIPGKPLGNENANTAGAAASGSAKDGNELVRMIRISKIEPDREQPRRNFKKEELEELAASIKNNGLLEPIIVQEEENRFLIIAGERRWRASQMAGLTEIPAIVKHYTRQERVEISLIENIQREDLNPIEEALSYKTLQDSFNLTQADVAEKVGKGRATVANAVRLLELPDEVKGLVQSRLLSVGHAKVLLSVESEKDRVLLARDCVNDQLTVRALEKKAARLHAPVPARSTGVPDLPDAYVRSLADKLKRHLGCAVRVTSGVTHANGKHTKGVLEIDFFDNDDLDRVIRMIGVEID